jgi:hypothetical protein
MREAQQALRRRDLSIDGLSISFKVPYRYWQPGSKDYISPSEVKAYVDSGHPLPRHRSHRSSSGSGYLKRGPGDSERNGSKTMYRSPSDGSTTTSDLSDTAVPSGYGRTVLPPLSEASTPQKSVVQKSPRKSPKKKKTSTISNKSSTDSLHCRSGDYKRNQTAGASEEEATQPLISIGKVFESVATSAAATPTTGSCVFSDPTDEGSILSTPRASSPEATAETAGNVAVDKVPRIEELASDTPSHKYSSPKTVEDADESFQTAAETPDPDLKAVTMKDTSGETSKTFSREAFEATPTPKVKQDERSSTTQSPVSNLESESTASTTTDAQNMPLKTTK